MAYGAVVGACAGSFLSAASHRFPHLWSLVTQRSRCPACGHKIKGYDNVPLISWWLLGARCRACRAPIPLRYALVETSCATAGALVVAAVRSDVPAALVAAGVGAVVGVAAGWRVHVNRPT